MQHKLICVGSAILQQLIVLAVLFFILTHDAVQGLQDWTDQESLIHALAVTLLTAACRVGLAEAAIDQTKDKSAQSKRDVTST